MSDAMIQTLSTGVIGALAAFELVAAARSWIEARNTAQYTHGRELWLSRRFAIRDHLSVNRRHVHALRSLYPALGTRRHAQLIRQTIQQVRRAPELSGCPAWLSGCPACRDSRFRGRPRCLDCGRRLVAPLQEARA